MKFFRIPVQFSFSSVFLFYIGLSIGAGAITNQNANHATIYTFSILGVTMLFGSLLFHERAHIFVAERYGIECQKIEIFIVGAIAYMKSMPTTPLANFNVAIAGPLMSFALAILLYTAAAILPLAPFHTSSLTTLVSRFTYFNFIIGFFNLLPIFPMDGGRILHSFLWWRKCDERKGRRSALHFSADLTFLLAAIMLIGGLLDILPSGLVFQTAIIAFLLIAMQKAELQKLNTPPHDSDPTPTNT